MPSKGSQSQSATTTTSKNQNTVTHESKSRRHVKRVGAIYIFLILFFTSWAAQIVSEYHQTYQEAQNHSQPFEFVEFLTNVVEATTENWQSEFLQLAAQLLAADILARRIFLAGKDDFDQIIQKQSELYDSIRLTQKMVAIVLRRLPEPSEHSSNESRNDSDG